MFEKCMYYVARFFCRRKSHKIYYFKKDKFTTQSTSRDASGVTVVYDDESINIETYVKFPKKDESYKVRWMVISLLVKSVILISLVTLGQVMYLRSIEAAYKENCERKLCASNMVCLNSYCQCQLDDVFVNKKCTKRSSFLDRCNNVDCNYNLTCKNGFCNCNSSLLVWSSEVKKCINSTKYTKIKNTYGESCFNDSNCDSNLNLICNSETNCQCPESFSSNKCDCIRNSNNEFYWNGIMCISAHSFGNLCAYDYQCKTVSEKTNCYNGFCNCGNSSARLFFNKSINQCFLCPHDWLMYNEGCYAENVTQDLEQK